MSRSVGLTNVSGVHKTVLLRQESEVRLLGVLRMCVCNSTWLSKKLIRVCWMEFRLSKDKVRHRALLNTIMRMRVLRRVKDIFTERHPISASAADLDGLLNFR